MDLLKMVEEYNKINEKARQVTQKTMLALRKQFIDLPFEMKQVKIQEEINLCNSNEKRTLQKTYYPILNVPEGFTKENESYIRNCANALNHEYTLRNEKGIIVKLEEHAVYDDTILFTKKGKICLPFRMITPSVSYKLIIENTPYTFKRVFEYEDLLEKIAKKKIGRGMAKNCIYYMYAEANKEYEEILKKLGITINKSLSEIVNSKCKQINLNEHFKAEFEISKEIIYTSAWIKNEFWKAYITKIPYVETCVEIRISTISNKEIVKSTFYWRELKDKKCKKGLSLQEAFELIKEE